LGEHDLLQVTDKPIVPGEVISRVRGEECGAVVTFIGKVRGYSEGRRVISLEHSAGGKEAAKLMGEIAGEVRESWDVKELVFCYRTGPVPPGEVTLVIAVAARHRLDAFAACEYAIDRFKWEVTSKEVREDG